MQYKGLNVNGGRLINSRPIGKSGIEEASEIRKALKRNEKAEIIANGIEKAEMRKEMRNFFG